MMKQMILAALLFAVHPALFAQNEASQNLPNAFPREGARKLLENASGVAWDVTWAPGSSTPMHRHAFDYVGVELADASFTVVSLDGKRRTITQKRGGSYFLSRGTTHIEEASGNIPPRHAVIIDLKDQPPPAGSAKSSGDFPEGTAKKLLENQRVVMWELAWPTGDVPVSRFYPHNAFIVFVEGGTLTSSVDGGPPRVLPISPGQVVFVAAGQAASERSTSGNVRAILIDLKN